MAIMTDLLPFVQWLFTYTGTIDAGDTMPILRDTVNEHAVYSVRAVYTLDNGIVLQTAQYFSLSDAVQEMLNLLNGYGGAKLARANGSLAVRGYATTPPGLFKVNHLLDPIQG